MDQMRQVGKEARVDNVRGVLGTTKSGPLREEVSSVRLVVCSRCNALGAATKWKNCDSGLVLRRVAEKTRQLAVGMSS